MVGAVDSTAMYARGHLSSLEKTESFSGESFRLEKLILCVIIVWRLAIRSCTTTMGDSTFFITRKEHEAERQFII